MVIASGVGAQLGFAEESTYGTYVAPTRFLPFEKESIKTETGKIRTAGLGLGRFHRTNKVRTYVKSAAGPVEFVVENKGFGLLFKHLLGSVASGNVGAVYTHTFTPDANALSGKFITLQVGRPDIGGTSRPFSFLGGKVTSWELAAALDEAVKLTPEFDFKAVDTGQSLAAASYSATPYDFTFVDGALTYAGSSKFARSFKVKVENMLATDRRGLGNTKKEPLGNGIATIEGELDCEWESLTEYGNWVNDTQAALVLTCTSPQIISGADAFKLIISIPKVELLGADTGVDGPDILKQPIQFKGLYDGSSQPITLTYITSDTAP
jgi:hypothetical protein